MRRRFLLAGGLLILALAAMKRAQAVISSNREVFSLYGSVLHPSPQSILTLQSPGDAATAMIEAVLLLLAALLLGITGMALLLADLLRRGAEQA
jgi:hypothetical protein